MQRNKPLTAKNVALIICFTALYTVFCFLPAFPIVGLPTKAITFAAITAPIIGLILGPYLGVASTILGGIIGFFSGFFSPPSFAAGVTTAFFAGMLSLNKRSLCIFTYFSLLFFFGFYPFIGPVWLYPPFMWFQTLGLLLLASPLQSKALKTIQPHFNKDSSRLIFSFFIFSLTSTLAGQIAGSLTFEFISWPVFMADVNAWAVAWQVLTWIYPVERTLIALGATFIGVPLYKVLTSANLMPSH